MESNIQANNTEQIHNIPKIIFIIPYRNRAPQLNHFKHFMKYILEDIPDSDYEIYYINQSDKKPFNRGGIKNIGFIAMREKYPDDYKNITFIFNDIDTMPSSKNLFDYSTTRGIIKHFYGYDHTLGGIVSVNGNDFETMNGFPNFWGWGLEDNGLAERANLHKIKIDRSNFYKYDDPMIININNDSTRLHSKEQIWRANVRNFAGISHIKNITYTYNVDMVIVTNFETEINPYNDTYYEGKNYAKIPADSRFRPSDAINTIADFKNGNLPVIGNRRSNRGVTMKLF